MHDALILLILYIFNHIEHQEKNVFCCCLLHILFIDYFGFLNSASYPYDILKICTLSILSWDLLSCTALQSIESEAAAAITSKQNTVSHSLVLSLSPWKEKEENFTVPQPVDNCACNCVRVALAVTQWGSKLRHLAKNFSRTHWDGYSKHKRLRVIYTAW